METPSQPDARRSERVRTRVPVTLVLDPQAHMLLHHTYTVDVSKFGMRVLANARMRPGQEVEVITGMAPEYAFRSRVVWVCATGPGEAREAGLEFLAPTSFEN